MSSQHSDDQTARSRPLTARQLPMPFALHTCGVTTATTLHTISYWTRLVHDSPAIHDPHALQEGRRLRSSRGRLARYSETLLKKRRAAAGCNLRLRISEPGPPPIPHAADFSSTPRASSLPQRLLSTTYPQISRTARRCILLRASPLRPLPGQEPHRAVPFCNDGGRHNWLFQPSPGSRLFPVFGF